MESLIKRSIVQCLESSEVNVDFYGVHEVQDKLFFTLQKCLEEVAHLFSNGHYDYGHNKLRILSKAIYYNEESRSKQVTMFTIARFHAIGFYFSQNWHSMTEALKSAIRLVSQFEKSFSIPAMTDALLLLSESYSTVNRVKDALYYAQQAVSSAQERLTFLKKVRIYANFH